MLKRGLAALISLSLCLTGPAGWAKAAPSLPKPTSPLSVAQTLDAQATLPEVMTGFNKLPKTRTELSRAFRIYDKGRNATGYAMREVLQVSSTLIVLAALTYKAHSDRRELDALSKGTFNQNVAYLPEKDFCAQEPGYDVRNDVLCSGDFILGLFAGGVFGAVVGAFKVVHYLLTKTPQVARKNPLMTVVLGLASMGSMVAVSTGASMLWSQATKYLPEDELKLAHGLMGRALEAKVAGRWDSFLASTDGLLLGKMTGIMYEIAFTNPTLRYQWLNNVWRFGIARGEFMSSMLALMGASMSGELAAAVAVPLVTVGVAGAGLAATSIAGATAIALTSAAIGFVVACVLGMYSMKALLDSSFPKSLTEALQNFRQYMAGTRVRGNLRYLEMVRDRFEPEYLSAMPVDAETEEGLRQTTLEVLRDQATYRDRWVNVSIEKYYELKLATEVMAQKINIAEAALKTAGLRAHLLLSIDGRALSYDEVLRKACGGKNDQTCIAREYELQLKTIDDFKKQIQEATWELNRLAMMVPKLYETDHQRLTVINDESYKKGIVLPFGVTTEISDFARRTWMMKENFERVFGILSPNLIGHFQLSMPVNPEDRQVLEVKARALLDNYYGFWFDETEVAKLLDSYAGQ